MLASIAPSELKLNRGLKIFRAADELILQYPVRGQAVIDWHLAPTLDAELYCAVVLALSSLNAGRRAEDLQPRLIEELNARGVLVDEGRQPREVVFECALPEADLARPLPEVDQLRALSVADFVRVESCRNGDSSEPLEPPAGQHGRLCWLYYGTSSLWLPFSVSDPLAEELAGAVRGQLSFAQLGPALASRLCAVAATGSRAQWTELRSRYRVRRHASLGQLLPAAWLSAFQRYCTALATEGRLRWDRGTVNQLWAHDEPLARLIHRQLARLVSKVAAEPSKPSYSFVSCYRPGAEVRAHVDRLQCEHSISMLVDRRPAADAREAWPLYMVEPDTRKLVAYRQGCGDAVLFKGRELPHFRRPLTAAEYSTSVLFHFVPEGFAEDVR